MSKLTRRDALGAAFAAPFVLPNGRSWAQENWPSRPIRMILPNAAGGGADLMLRIVCARMSELLKQPIVIDNRPGGASVMAAAHVQTLPRDGYTFFNNSSWHIITPLLEKNLPFDFSKVFVPVAQGAAYPQAVTVPMNSPFKTPQDLLDYAKARPGALRCGTPARGGMGHMAMVEIELRSGTSWLNVPYRNSPDAPRDLAGGQLDAVITSTSTNLPFLQSGMIRPVAITSPKRIALMPDIPTLSETVLPGYDMDDWNGLFAVAGTPDWAIARLQQVFAEVSREPAVLAKMKPLGTELVASTPAEFTAFLAEQQKILGNIVKNGHVAE